MNKKTNYNSIVFLTTLSVYLGLVLVGGAPMVSAQQPVIVPCDERELRQEASKKFAEIGLINEYVYILPRLSGILLNDDYVFVGNINAFDIDVVLSQSKEKLAQPEFRINLGKIGTRKISYSEDLLRNVGSIVDIVGRSGCDFEHFGCSPFELNLRLDDAEFSAHLKYIRKSSSDAKKFAQAYRASIEADACLYATEPLRKFRFENTEVSTGNNQVFIVTRLPRASIDELLARKVAQ